MFKLVDAAAEAAATLPPAAITVATAAALVLTLSDRLFRPT